MALVNVVADFEKLVVTLERIDLHLAHGVRILEAAFPLESAALRWTSPSEKLQFADDQELLAREDQQARETKQPVVSELGDEAVAADYDPYDLEPGRS